MAQGARKNRGRKLVVVFTLIVVVAVGLVAIRTHGGALAEFVKPYVDSKIDKYIPGGDNRTAKAAADAVIDAVTGDPGNAFLGAGKVFFTPSSTASQEQDTPLDRETVRDQPVVPVSPSNENAVPVHNETADQTERPTGPPSEPSVGVSPPPPDVHGPLVSLSPNLFSAIGASIEAANEGQPPIAHLGTGVFGGGGGSLFMGSVGATGSVPSSVGISHPDDHGGDHGGGGVAHGGGWAGGDRGAAGHADTMVASR